MRNSTIVDAGVTTDVTTETVAGARSAGIDVLRGMSILLVVVHHAALRVPLEKTSLVRLVPRRILLALGYNGYEAVFVFFVVSGFLISATSLRRWSSLGRIDPHAFYVRRFARIAPCLLLLVAMLSVFDLLHVPDFVIEGPGQTLGRAVFSALALHLNWYEGRTGYLPAGWDVLWSLSIEEVFYIGFPLACFASRNRTALLVVPLILLALSLPLTRGALAGNEIWQEKAYLPGMAAIATGVLAAMLADAPPGLGRWSIVAFGWLGVICLGAILLIEDLLWRLLGELTMLVLTFGTASLVWSFGRGWRAATLASSTAPLRSFGRLSYEIYLTHMFVVLPVIGLFHRTGLGARLGWLCFPPAIALAWALGWALDRAISSPANRWLLARWSPSSSPDAVGVTLD